MNLDDFRQRFGTLKKRGYIKSLRRGPTGVGYTLETELGILENNIAEPDIDKIELKSHRVGSGSLITLFTFNRKVWQIPPLDAVRKYGSLDRNGRLGMYYTMSLKPNSAGLFLNVTADTIDVRHISGEVIAVWQLAVLAQRFMQKIPAMILVSALSEMRDSVEYFHFHRARLMQGTSVDVLAGQFREENIVVDLRLHDKGTRARNHGTGFRAYEDRLPHLFATIKEL